MCASVLVTGTLSRAVSTVITGDAKEEIYRSVSLFFALSLLTILLGVLNRFLAFFRTKKTGCAIEDDILAYYYAIPYTDEINKDEVQANMSKTVQEFNSMYYTYKTSVFRVASTIFFSCAHALSIHWLSLAGMVFLGVLTVLVYREDLQEVSKLREKIGEKRNLLYRNLWESVENLEIERFLNERKIFEKYQENSRGLVDYRVKSNKRQVKGQLYSELGTGCLVILIAVLYAAFSLVVEGGALGYQKSGQILDNINLVFRPERLTAVCGENGSGKTTLLRALTGMFEGLHSGAAEWEGGISESSSITYIPVDTQLFYDTVQNNVQMIFQSQAAEELPESMTQEYALIAQKNKDEISEGQRQITNVIRAWNRKGILIGDEITGSLAPGLREKVIKELLERYETAVLVVHDRALLPYFDRVIMVKDGKVTEG